MSEQKIYPVPEAFKRQTLMDRQTYDRWYQQSIDDPDTFWAERADQLLDWQTRWDTVSDYFRGTTQIRRESFRPWFESDTVPTILQRRS